MSIKKISILTFICALFSQSSILNGNQILHETKLHPIPGEMTFDEYQDMNRRISLGLMLSAVPIPGSIHEYAGESKTARRLRMLGAVGFGLVIAGASMETTKSVDSEFESLSLLPEGGVDYYQIPVSSTSVTVEGITTTTVEYKLKKVENEGKGNGLVILMGAGLLVANYAYDYYYGLKTIERKRNLIRFKYGKLIDLGFKPKYSPLNQAASISLYCEF